MVIIFQCKTMHFSKKNSRSDFHLQGDVLEKTEVEKDPGVLVASDLKPSTHVAQVAAKTNSTLRIITRSFTFINKEIFLSLCQTLDRPTVEYAVQCWLPYLL